MRHRVRTDQPLRMHLPAELAVSSIVRRRMVEWLLAYDWPVDDRDDLVAAVHEAVANVIDHAYGDGPAGSVQLTGSVHLVAGDRHTQAVVTVRDRGRWKPAAADPGYRGHGITMMNGLMDGVEIRNHVDGTEVVLTGAIVSIGLD